jgi:cell division septal protein FtsQ
VSLHFRDTLPLDHEPGPLLARARRVLGAGLAGAVAVTVVGLLAHEVAHGAAWEVYDVEVVGNVRSTDIALRHLADIRDGTHLSQVDLRRAVQRVEKHPWVSRAEARRVFPSGVAIVVEEHEPALLLALDELWYVDARGEVFLKADSGDLDYPILTGLSPAVAAQHPQLARALLRHALDVVDAARGHETAGPEHISELRFDDATGFTLVLRTGTELVLGFDHIDERLGRLDRLVAAGFDPRTPQRLDLAGDRIAVATPLDRPAGAPPGKHGEGA